MPEVNELLKTAALAAERRLEVSLGDEAGDILALSDYLVERAAVDREWFAEFVAAKRYEVAPDSVAVAAEVRQACDAAADLAGLQTAFRRLRHRCMVHLIWRHASRRAPLEETVANVSALAEVCLDAALERVYAWRCAALGEPVGDTSGAVQRLVVLALGKLGARELNLSSDIDLMFAYPEAGKTASGKSNQQFFVEVCQQLIQALDTPTGDGFVFRVDTRLRPFGESGPLVASFAATEDYYESQGRDWERYALVKLRPCAGAIAQGEDLIAALRPFVFRRYLDFSAVGSLRDMKRRIDRERAGSAVRDNVKLGPGGIREIEFIVQMLQLTWAGKRLELQEVNLAAALERLCRAGLMSATDADELRQAYRFLRDAEHSIQAIHDRQAHSIPADELGRARVAKMTMAADWATFAARLEQHRATVSRCFDQAIADADTVLAPALSPVAEVWLERLGRARDRPNVAREGRDRLDALLPVLLRSIAAMDVDEELGLSRIVPILEAVLRRSAYLLLLVENAGARDQLVDLAVRSCWIAEQIARYPVLLDDLLIGTSIGDVPTAAALREELDDRIAQIGADDQERMLDVLREFKLSHVFRVAVAEMNGTLPLMRVSDYLTFLGEAIVGAVLNLAWVETVGVLPVTGFVVIGYGKMGGLELGPGSDLDLVFLHDFEVSEHQKLHRLVRRFLHILTAQTSRGRLYEVDTRLRPSGNSGTLVTAVTGFERYLLEDAWTWEHQALVRARVVAGADGLGERFRLIRRVILALPRDRDDLRRDIMSMRQRIAGSAADDGDLKRGPGGIVDIEFLVQYLVLAFAHEHAELLEYTDNVRILDAAAELGLIGRSEAEAVTSAYLAMRSEWHRSVLDLPDVERVSEVMQHYQESISKSWDRVFSSIEEQ